MIRIAICDDDQVFASKLEEAVRRESRQLGIRTETDTFTDGDMLVADIQKGYRYEIIFFDIEMERVNGIDAARAIRKIDRSVIFLYVSGYDQYFKELFEVEPFRFLSKPLNYRKFCRYFREACQKASETEVFYQFTFNKAIRKVPLKDVIYFESQNRLVHILLQDGSREHFYGKLNEVESNLSESRKYFLRIHQSYLVNYDYIRRMDFSNLLITFDGKEVELKISEDRQKNVRQQLCQIAGGKMVVE